MKFQVLGVPAPQGSKKAFQRGSKIVLVEQSDRVKPWRQAVAAAAMQARLDGAPVLEGCLAVEVTFYLKRPKAAARRALPNTRPDLDKLLRSTLDGISDSGVWHDDAQVVSLVAHKRYATDDPDQAQGALIGIVKVG